MLKCETGNFLLAHIIYEFGQQMPFLEFFFAKIQNERTLSETLITASAHCLSPYDLKALVAHSDNTMVKDFEDWNQTKAHAKAQKASSIGHETDYWYLLVSFYTSYHRILKEKNVKINAHLWFWMQCIKNAQFFGNTADVGNYLLKPFFTWMKGTIRS